MFANLLVQYRISSKKVLLLLCNIIVSELYLCQDLNQKGEVLHKKAKSEIKTGANMQINEKQHGNRKFLKEKYEALLNNLKNKKYEEYFKL